MSTIFRTQANALIRKNATQQRRNTAGNLRLILQPLILCIILKLTLNSLAVFTATDDNVDCNTNNLYMSMMGGEQTRCSLPHPPKWPVLFQVPAPELRATWDDFTGSPYQDMPPDFCRKNGSCPVSTLITGQNRSLSQSLGMKLLGGKPNISSDPFTFAAGYILGTLKEPGPTNYFETAFSAYADTMYIVQLNCTGSTVFPLSVPILNSSPVQDVKCVEGLQLWRDSSSDINNELYIGYRDGNPQKKINEFLGAYDFLNTDEKNFNVSVWYNASYGDTKLTRVLRAANAASNSYLQFSKGDEVKMLLEFVKEMPKGATRVSKANYSMVLIPSFLTLVIQLLLPVLLEHLVYEKQKKLRTIMKMHGLGDRVYWLITYTHLFLISSLYMLSLLLFGSLLGLKSFTQNDYSMQFVFYFFHINLEIAFAFCVSVFFSDVNTATVVGYLYVLVTCLLGPFFFEKLIRDPMFPRLIIEIMEIIPAFSLYRGLYEFGQFTYEVEYVGTPIITWRDVTNGEPGLISVLKLMVAEWMVLLLSACYLDQILSNGVSKHLLWFLPCFSEKPKMSFGNERHDFRINMEEPAVSQEREMVDRVAREAETSHAIIICNDLKKVYPSRNGNSEKHAVRGLSLAIPAGECFGILGPSGAEKTSFMNMMTGCTTPTSGTAFVLGLDISKDMDEVYTSMGVCPQDDLIWETLSGIEHLLFYGRLKNLKGASLTQAVEESLQSVNLFEKGAEFVGTYDGGMKRRLSVAISLIGNPRVVYLDEPSTGLGPASRKNLWNVVQCATRDKAIILTTHSKEEAEYLCDRVGIFVDGSLQCLGTPKELKARYGGYYMFTVTTPAVQEEEVEKLVYRLSPKAKKVYHLSGTQKFQLPKEDCKLADVFREVGKAKSQLSIQAWGVSKATLEDVFLDVARGVPLVEELS